MELQTKVKIEAGRRFSYNSRYMMFGSCFAQNIGEKMLGHRFCCDVNPFGILYNPFSIAKAIERTMDNRPMNRTELTLHNGLWHSWLHHGSFSSGDADKSLAAINSRMEAAAQNLMTADCLIITFGSSVVYERDGEVVANCHKLPARAFTERRLTVSEITERYTALITRLREYNPTIHIILTVSPVRYMGRGAFDGNCNKAVLLLAVEELCRSIDGTSYFPSYEIVMDELRDYRFYAEDMIHPSPQAVEYVWERMCASLFSDETRLAMKEIDGICKALAHRPFHPDSDEYAMFLEKTREKIVRIKEKYPSIVI